MHVTVHVLLSPVLQGDPGGYNMLLGQLLNVHIPAGSTPSTFAGNLNQALVLHIRVGIVW